MQTTFVGSEAGAVRRKSTLADRYREVRSRTTKLAEPLGAEDQLVQSMPDVSPTKWHLAHTTWFFETFVLEGQNGYRSPSPAYAFLFNSYYNAVGAQYPRPRRGLISRPSLEEVRRYRDHVDQAMASLLERGVDRETARVIELGLNHEQQHQELILSDIKHVLAQNPLEPVYREAPQPGGEAPAMTWRGFDGGEVAIGYAGEGFCYDNETPRHRLLVQPFELASRLVTAGEYLGFVEDGGYQRPELWLSEGWDWLAREAITAPLYWRRKEDGWHLFTLAGARPLHHAEPVVHVSLYEADAFARWAGARLPREQELELALSECASEGNFVETGRLHPAPASGGAPLEQLWGDAWEWTQSQYLPYPGYQPSPGALGEYNGKFMCNQHVLRGGSCFSPKSHLRASYRNFFPAAARWQMSGIRLARDARSAP